MHSLVPEILQLDSTQFIGKLVLHDDEEIATTCSHALQKITVENPSVRPKIIQVNTRFFLFLIG